MRSNRLARRVAAYAGGAAIVAMVGLTAACGGGSQKAPETSTTTTTTAPSSAPSVTPTEKSINPTGGNLFTPPVKAPPAPTAIPGDN
ncbi:MAG: hypothetical protein JWR46_1385 [Mycobacterium sp.]|jgi:hypothetical protein|nr:hypothetical protein [Mycobacterium sp.]MCW2553099.1 hypothetical protein [Mycobacterium sp.]MCW2730884.1 hypothetical protein [Mycobacterium sp.]MDT5074421.1 hypothetical protein [Mycobacterium sp.]